MMIGLGQLRIVSVIALCLVLSGCYVNPPLTHQTTANMVTTLKQSVVNNSRLLVGANNTIPLYIYDALMPTTVINTKVHPLRFDINVLNVPIKSFLASLAHNAACNIIANPKLKDHITLQLQQVSVEQIMAALQDLYGYQYSRNSYGYVVYPPQLQTHFFVVNYLNVRRYGQSQTAISSGQISRHNTINNYHLTDKLPHNLAASTVTTISDNQFWHALTTTLKATINVTPCIKDSFPVTATSHHASDCKIVVDPQVGIIMVRAYPKIITAVSNYLDTLQAIVNREVVIEAKILEVTLNSRYQSGIDWQLLGITQQGSQTFNQNLGPFNSIFSVASHWRGGFSGLIKLLSTQGRVNVISSPRIATINNQKALIKIGSDEFFVTGVDSTTNTATSTTSISQNVNLTPFFSGVALDVTPEIDHNGAVILHIHPIISQVAEKQKQFTVSGKKQDLPLAVSTIRESDNMVRARNNEIVIIGGLMENRFDHHQAQVPLLGHLPIIGGLFTTRNEVAKKSEIVILLKPIVITHHNWHLSLQHAAKQFDSMTHSFSFNTIMNQSKTRLSLQLSPNLATHNTTITTSQSRLHRPHGHLVITPDSNNPYRLALIALENGKLDQANGILTKLLGQSDHPKIRTMLSWLLIKQGLNHKAAQVLRNGLKHHPHNINYVMLLAHILVSQGQIKPALALLQTLKLIRVSDHVDYFALLAALYLRQHHYQLAAQFYRQLLGNNRYRSQWWLGLALALKSLQQLNLARLALIQAKQLNNLSPLVQNYVNQQLRQLS